MANWIDELRSRGGPLTEAAVLFAARLGVERDPPAGAAGLLALARGVEHHLQEREHDGPDAEEESDRRFIELAGSYLGVLLCAALPRSQHASRAGRHGLSLGARGFFDPFAAIERLFDADDVRSALAEQVAEVEDAALRGGRDALDLTQPLLPRLLGPRFLAEVERRAHGRALHLVPVVHDVQLGLALSGPGRVRYVGASDLERWGLDPADARRAALANLARASAATRLLHVEGDQGVLVVARTGDGHDAARVLLPGLHDVLARELGSPFAAAIPHRDALFACSLRSENSLRLLRERALHEAGRVAHPISAELVVVRPGGGPQALGLLAP